MKTSAEHMLLKVAAALESIERTRTELVGLRYCLDLLKKEQAVPVRVVGFHVTPEGWSNLAANSANPPTEGQQVFAPRHGCEWNTQERNDLRRGLLTEGLSVSQLAARHRRTEGSINSEIGRWFNACKGE
jgi:hypothetical protein